MENIGTVIELRSGEWRACSLCSNMPHARTDSHIDISVEPQANHFLQEHGATLLHAGQETGTSADGSPRQYTVVVLGLPR